MPLTRYSIIIIQYERMLILFLVQDGWTPLHRASVSVKGTATVRYLLQHHAFFDPVGKVHATVCE